jgi:succinate dehydrogenase / fumarate reductase membrane anchor subunit
MIETKSVQRPDEATGLWLVKVLLGALIVIILTVHLIVNHYVGEGALLTWQNVVDYFSNPWIVFMEITFLIVVVSHSLIGLRSIILDLNPSKERMKIVDWSLYVVGVISIVYGIWLALKIASFSS